MKKKFYFLAGLPRSGSTLLSAILNQHPDVYVTPTSPMLNLLVENQNAWHKCSAVIANPEPEQLTNITKAMINATWAHISKPIIIDNNREWNKNISAATILFEEKVKIIATIRDLPSIMASWLTLLRNQSTNVMDKKLIEKGIFPTDESRLAELWFNMVKSNMESIQLAKKEAGDRLLLISYDNLIDNTVNILYNLEEFLGVPHFEYNLDNIQNNTTDYDLAAWGFDGLHTIRSKIKKTASPPQEILGDALYNKFIQLEKNYS